jgi:serine protease Do
MDSAAENRALRRTRVVEVFENWKDSVAFVTGPVVKNEKAVLEEFFMTDGRMPRESNVGTGFIIHKSGFVVTNAHGVEKTVFHVVILADGSRQEQRPAELIAVSHAQDIALLKVESPRVLKPVRLAQSNDVMIGETVIVIGNPIGLRNTCTAGVLSAIGRTTHIADLPGVTLSDALQSDAGINPGSSGGPWFNVVGDVIGMTASMKRDAQNIAFAVSAATLRKALPKMLKVERRYGFATGMDVAPDGRCVVALVEPGSAADKAGVHSGDVITKLADEPIAASLDFHLALVDRKPGETLLVEVLRNGVPQSLSLRLAPRPKPDAKAIILQKIGLQTGPLDRDMAKALGLRPPRGLVISGVDPAVYEKVQHQPQVGDILARIGSIRPRDQDQAAELVEDLQRGDAIDLVLVRRKENTATRLDIHLVLPR